jgi:hypothetical protein
MKKKKSFKDFILSDEVFENVYVILMVLLLLIGIWFGVVETIIRNVTGEYLIK